MFHTRYTMHKQVYTHKVSKSIEYMVCDALILANPYLKIFDQLDNPEEFCYLTDGILNDIERSTQKELEESRNIIKRIRKRQLYKLADEVLIPPAKIDQLKNHLTPKSILNHGNDITENDIILCEVKMNYALKDKNPVDEVHFFTRYATDSLLSKNTFLFFHLTNFFNLESFPIQKENVSLLIPDQFSEVYWRVYVRNSDKLVPVQEAFRKFLKEVNCTPSPAHSLPKEMSEEFKKSSALKKRKITFEQ